MEVDLGAKIVKSCNALGSEVWPHFKTNDPNALLDPGLVSSVFVSTHSLGLVF